MEAVKTLTRALRKRGYSRQFLRRIAKEERLKGNITPILQKRVLPLILKFSKTAKSLAATIRRNFHTTFQDNQLTEDYRMVAAFSRGRNLGDLLVHSKLKYTTAGTTNRTTETFVRGLRRSVIRIDRPVSLNTQNCIYLIFCASCGRRYVGETKNSIRTRMCGHRASIRKGQKGKGHIVPHFLRHGIHNLRVRGLEHGINWTKGDRLRRERFWIRRLGTAFPRGLNVKIGIH